jgi:hypothetical protein
MNDDEVWTAVKKTLSDVQMDRPVETIEQRGRARRRNRGLLGATASGGLAAVAALALVLPTASDGSGTAPAGNAPGAVGSAPALEPAAFTLVKQTDGSVKLTLDSKKLLNPAALEKALAGADIPAVVKAGALCTPKGEELPETKKVFGLQRATTADGSRIDVVLRPASMPKGSIVYFSVFAVHKGDDYNKIARYLVTKNAPMTCRTIA